MGILDYGFKPRMKFYTQNGVTSEELENELYLGCEVELDGSCLYEDELDECADLIEQVSDNMVYVKEDCSLDNGIECVTYPMTIERLFEFNWDGLLDNAHEYGEYANETCGFHVHVNKSFIGDWSKQLTVAKLWSRFHRRFKLLGMRNTTRWCHWNDVQECTEVEFTRQLDRGRYHAVNMLNGDTVEFRLFAASDDSNHIKFMADVVQASVKFALAHTFAEIAQMSWATVMNGLREYAYDKELYDSRISLSLEGSDV